MQIIRCTQEHATMWDAFVARNDAATFYHRFGWKAVNEKGFGHETFYLAAVDGSEVRGIFPLVLLRSRIFGKILCSMPFVNLGGPCAADESAMTALMREASAILGETQARFLEVRSRSPLATARPPSTHKVSMTVALAPDPATVWNAFTPKHRKNIRHATNHGYRTVIGGAELLDDFYRILSDSWRSLGTPLYAKTYFDEIMRVFEDSIAIFLVLKDDEAVGTALCGHHRSVAEGMWAGTASKYRGSDSNYVLYWDMIRHYCEAGFAKFHLGRSTADSGAEAFKKKWLASTTQLYWHYIAGASGRIPQLSVQNPKFQLAIKTWRHLPLSLTRRIGPVISKGIP